MKFHRVLEEVLGTRSNIAIIRVLAEKDLELIGRQIAQLSGLNHRTCQLSLKELAAQGIVTSRKIGKANLFKLKKENMLVKEGLLPLLEVERQLLNEVQLIVSNKLGTKAVLSLILFGSTALGREKPDSDLDICVIARNEDGKAFVEQEQDSLAQTIMESFGNSLALYPLTIDEFGKKYRRGDRLIKEIVQTGKVFWGKPLEEILKHGRKE